MTARVLVIDDDEIAGEAVRQILEAEGHTAWVLPSPIGATQAIIKEKVSVVVLDVHMPSISGDKLAQLLRRNPRLDHLGIVLISGIQSTELSNLANDVGADAVVVKRELHQELAQAVSLAYRLAQTRRPSSHLGA